MLGFTDEKRILIPMWRWALPFHRRLKKKTAEEEEGVGSPTPNFGGKGGPRGRKTGRQHRRGANF